MVVAAIIISIEAAMLIIFDATLEVKGFVLGILSSSRAPPLVLDMEVLKTTELGPCAPGEAASA